MVIALWGAALFGLICALIPAAAIERFVEATGIAAVIPAAGQPLTVELHLALAAIAAAIGGWLGLTLARRVTVAQYNALPTSSNRMARITRQAASGAGGPADDGSADLAIGETAHLSFAPSSDVDHLSQPRFDISSEPITIWGDAPPAASPGACGAELPELLLGEDLEAGEDPQWQDTASPSEADEAYFQTYADWPSEPASDFGAVQDEPREARPDTAPDYDDGLASEPDLFAAPAEPDPLTDGGGMHVALDPSSDLPSFETEDDGPVLPADDEEIGQFAREAEWPSTPAAISADLDSFGEPEDEDDVWPVANAAEQASGWNEADLFDSEEEEDEEPSSIFDTTLGAFRDYARDYTGGDDGEDEEEEEEEDDTNSSFGSLLGMTVRRRAADEPIELVGFDGEPVALSDFEMEIPDELEGEAEYDSPLLVRRRMGGA